MIKLYYIILDYTDYYYYFLNEIEITIDIDWFLEKHIIVY